MVLANTSIHMVGGAPKNGSHRVSVARVSRISPRDSPGSPGRSDPGSYPLTASALGSGVQENLCTPFKNEVSIPPALSFFQKQAAWASKQNALEALLPGPGPLGWKA